MIRNFWRQLIVIEIIVIDKYIVWFFFPFIYSTIIA